MEYELDLEQLNKTNKLTPKQEKFCQEFVLSLNKARSYQKAYGCTYEVAQKNAYKLMANNGVQTRIRELQEEMEKEYKITASFLINKSMEVIAKSLEGQPQMMMDRNGNPVPTGNIQYDMRAVNDAIRNISSITGLNVQKVQAQVDADVKTTTKIEDMAKDILDV